MSRENQWSTWRNGRLVEVARYTERHQLGMIRIPVATLDPDLNRTALQDAEEIVRSHNERGELVAALAGLVAAVKGHREVFTMATLNELAEAEEYAVMVLAKVQGGAQ